MGHDLNTTPQSEGDDQGLNLELSLAPPSSSPPHRKPKRLKLVNRSPLICHKKTISGPQLAPFQVTLFPLVPSQPEPLEPWPSQRESLQPSSSMNSSPLANVPIASVGISQQEPLQPSSPMNSSPLATIPMAPVGISQRESLKPWPVEQGLLQFPVLTPQLSQRECKRKANDISTEPPSPCSNSTNHHKPATTKDRRQRTKADHREIDPPYPWSTNRLAKIHTMEYLRSNNMVTITGEVECNQCKRKYEMEYDLVSKFEELARFIARIREDCNDRAPSSWATPTPLNCSKCKQQNCVEAVIPKSDFKNINWLFLFLGQMLGNLQLDQLRYFCTHTNNHRTGAKDRLLYQTYITLCEQLNGN